MTNSNPYVFQSEANQLTLTKVERERYKNAFAEYLKQYKPSFNFAEEIKQADSFADLGKIIGKLEYPMLFNLAMSRLMEFSPDQFKQFTTSFDDTLNLVSCLEGEISEAIDNIPSFDNGPSKAFEFNVDFDIDLGFLQFDFFKVFRNELYSQLEKFAVRIIIGVIEVVAPYIDADRINKCTVPCEKDRNPYKNTFSKAIVKTGAQTMLLLQDKIQQNKLSISPEELRKYIKKSIETLSPDELDCIIQGFMSNEIIIFLIDLFENLFDGDDIVRIFNNVDNIIDLVPGSDTLSPTSPCGDLHIENFRRLQLERQGFSPTEIHQSIATTVAEHTERLRQIVDIINKVPLNISDKIRVVNAEITTSTLNKSIDNTFDSLGKIYKNSMEMILKQILVNPTGEICIAYFYSKAPNNNFGLSPSLMDYMEKQLNPVEQSMFENPLSFSFSSNFYEKYQENLEKSETTNNFLYFDDKVYMTVNDETRIIVNRTTVSVYVNNFEVQIPTTQSDELQGFIAINNRKDALESLIYSNNSSVFNDIELTIEPIILSTLFSTLKIKIGNDMGRNFFFADLNNNPKTKKEFIAIDYFNLETEKTRVKDALNE